MNSLTLNNKRLWQKLCSLDSLRERSLESNGDKKIVNLEGAREIVLRCLEREGFRRIIVGIGGFPASGKTTAAKSFVSDLNVYHANLAAHLPMDGFHFSNMRLAGEGLEGIKGDITTYDITAYIEKLREYESLLDRSLFAPDYVREQHEVFENRIEIPKEVRVLMTEGIYVGHIEGEWEELRDLLTISFYLDAHPEQCVDRIVARNLEVGRSESMIESKLSNDLLFMETSVQILEHADYIIRLSS